MAGAATAAKNFCLQQQVPVDRGSADQASTKSSSPSPSSDSFTTEDTSIGSREDKEETAGLSSTGLAWRSGEQQRMNSASWGDEKAPNAYNTSTGSIVAISVEERCSTTDPDDYDGNNLANRDQLLPQGAASTVVAHSVIRVSPSGPDKAGAVAAAQGSSRAVPVVRPVAVKTPPRASTGIAERAVDSTVRVTFTRDTVAAKNLEQNGKGSTKPAQAPHSQAPVTNKETASREHSRRKQEAQISFPERKPHKRMPPTSRGRAPAGVPQVDGAQAPAQHVQYSTGSRQQHHRQDPHPGYRHAHHGRGAATRATSVTSSVDGTPTATARRPQHPRGLSESSQPTDNEMSPAIPPSTPLFQKLVTEEVQELKHFTRIIEEQNRRLIEVESIMADLEKKLQKQTRMRGDLEQTLELREAEWTRKFKKLDEERANLDNVVTQKERVITRLNDQVARMEQEIHRMLQRKYDHQRGETVAGSVRGIRVQNDRGSPSLMTASASGGKAGSSASPGPAERKKEQFTSPREILQNEGAVEVVRKRNISDSLLDFFGM